MYKVLTYFTDLQDDDYPYDEGDIFPRNGLIVSDLRLRELSSTSNRRGIKLIELVENEQVKEEPKPLTKTEINRMNIAELKRVAKENGIEDSDEKTGAEIKKLLIERFEL